MQTTLESLGDLLQEVCMASSCTCPLRHCSSAMGPGTTLPSLLSGVAQAGIRVFPENSSYYRPVEMGCFSS